MTRKTALKTILVISVGGMLFSGYLSYNELFGVSCTETGIRCGSFSLFNLPACVYGLLMYTLLFVTSILGLKSRH